MTLPFRTLDDLIDWFMVNKTLIFRYGSKLIGPSIWIYHNSHHRSTLTESPNNLCRVPTCQQLRVSVALSPPEANYYVWGYLFFPLGLPMLPVTWIQREWGSEWHCHSKILRSAYVCCKPYIHFRNAKIGVLAREMRSQDPSYIALFIDWLVNTWLQQLLIGPLYKLNNPIETNLLHKRLRGTPLSSLQ